MTTNEVAAAQCVGCKGKLFYNWGMEIMVTPPGYKTDLRGNASKFAESVTNKWVHVCAGCQHPYYLDEGQLISATDMVSIKDVRKALEAVTNMFVRGKNINP